MARNLNPARVPCLSSQIPPRVNTRERERERFLAVSDTVTESTSAPDIPEATTQALYIHRAFPATMDGQLFSPVTHLQQLARPPCCVGCLAPIHGSDLEPRRLCARTAQIRTRSRVKEDGFRRPSATDWFVLVRSQRSKWR
jgi:hypothetical protein